MGKLVTKNKKAYFDYEVLETLEAGIVLTGDEVKSLRAGQISLTGAYATVHDAELYLINCNITHYKQAFSKTDDLPTRRRKLLLHRREINRIIGDISRKGITVMPLTVYFNDRNIAKVTLGVCKHKKAEGKKQALKERDIKREMDREVRGRG